MGISASHDAKETVLIISHVSIHLNTFVLFCLQVFVHAFMDFLEVTGFTWYIDRFKISHTKGQLMQALYKDKMTDGERVIMCFMSFLD